MFVIGLCVGSFVNVVIYRTLHGMSPYKGRSICDNCKRQLTWYENIPLVSYVVLGGKCRTCKKQIDWSYPVVEFATGLLFLWWASLGVAFFRLSTFPHLYLQPAFWLVVGIILVLVFFVDWLYGIIPDFAVATLGLLTLGYRVYLVTTGVMQASDFWLSVLAGLVSGLFFLALYLGTRGKGMGFGDVKFSVVMGFLLGYPKAIVGFFVSFLIGAVVGVGVLLYKKKMRGQRVPFGPFLILGLVIALVWGEEIWRWYMGVLGV